MNPNQVYSRADVVRWLGKNEVLKGLGYLNAVSELNIEEGAIFALVKGTARQPYQVSIYFSYSADELFIEAGCTCPVGYDCKHAAAVLLAALEQRSGQSQVNPAVLQWLENFRRVSVAKPKKIAKSPAKRGEQLFYVLEKSQYSHQYGVALLKGVAGNDGAPQASAADWDNVERALLQPPKFVDDEDMLLLRLLWAMRGKSKYIEVLPLTGTKGDEFMTRAIATGRLFFSVKVGYYDRNISAALTLGSERSAQLEWLPGEDNTVTPAVVATPAAKLTLALGQLWYVDPKVSAAGILQADFSAVVVAQLMALPPLKPADVPVVSGALRELAPQLPLPDTTAQLRVVDVTPVPVLTLATTMDKWIPRYRGYKAAYGMLDYATLTFRYGDLRVDAVGKSEYHVTTDGETVHVKRRPKVEAQWLHALAEYGLLDAPNYVISQQDDKKLLMLNSESAWTNFMQRSVPQLRVQGCEIQTPQGFRHHVLEVSDWEAEITDDANGWLSLDMGIVVEGQRLPLAPLLHGLFQRDQRWLDATQLKLMPDDEKIPLVLPDGAQVLVPAGRLKTPALLLIDLFDSRPQDVLQLSRLDAPRLAELVDQSRWKFKGDDAVRQMADRLKHSDGIKPAIPPAGFALQLRPYQLEGLAWLQFLREQGLAGILADDMGLGKTAQTLAHLLLEKEAGRLDKPALVVLPTSLIFNWKQEAARFAPDLKVLSLHGKERAPEFARILEHDVVLTTYPLLWRDEELLSQHEYHMLILDEAQTVKNVASQAAQVVRRLQARHRLCLTGTPLENHLGELWAQFDFLLPGFLGDGKSFTKAWRTPIEKYGDTLRRDLLARRIKPFILRRRKQDVAKELPPKTIIVRSVELDGGQRDLYEAVRSAMDKRVRDEIASKGFARSHIVILDALLKLRQVCCDPRLLKSDAAQRVKERAKLDMLMDMLPELVSEGRRILVFSQFTSMLDLIEAELVRHKLGYVMLTGDTKDREAVVGRFQAEEVPIFLISLKAGGVGLNLTAADTVIHFDPWWNPAAENQATDRAHRIGQSKNVFVYKLVVAGSIEEKILALQEKKADLAAGVLSEDASGLTKFGTDDLSALLAPLAGKQ